VPINNRSIVKYFALGKIDGILRAAQIRLTCLSNGQGFVSWPSQGKLHGYNVDPPAQGLVQQHLLRWGKFFFYFDLVAGWADDDTQFRKPSPPWDGAD
jgi:hypothetical protein